MRSVDGKEGEGGGVEVAADGAPAVLEAGVEVGGHAGGDGLHLFFAA